MILFLAALITLVCVVLSLRHLDHAIGATPLDPAALALGLRDARPRKEDLRRAFEAEPDADWERDVIRAFDEQDERRAAFLAEAMSELDFRVRRWSRVPRVCASLSSSFAFLLATLSVRIALAGFVGTLDEAEIGGANEALLGAVDVVAIGLAGAAVCAAVHYRARSLIAARLDGAERLVELFERMP